MKQIAIKTIFENWLGACIHGPIGDHVLDTMVARTDSSMVDEKTQLQWLNSSDWNKVRAYTGRWYQSASMRLIAEAPDDIVKQYLLYCVPLDAGHQEVLVKRDINNGSDLSWYYFVVYSACETVQELLRRHDILLLSNPRPQRLWFCVLLRNYVWPLISEQALSAETEELLLPHLNETVDCPLADISAKVALWLKL